MGDPIAIAPAETDTGSTLLTVGTNEQSKRVLLTWPQPRSWMEFDPANAMEIGEAMAREAYRIQHGKLPPGKRSVINDQIHQKLVTRLNIVIRDLIDRQKPVPYIAATCVDLVLSECVGE